MKKIMLVISLLMVNQLLAEQYIMIIDKTNYKDAIQIACNEGLILNEENNCINPIPTCEDPLVLNESQDACIDPILDVNWINTTGDACKGMRQANFDSNVYFARSKSSSYSLGLTIPQGYHWVTKSEYAILFNASTVSTKNNGIHAYYAKCGLPSYPVSITGQNQHVLLFSGGGTSGMHTGNHEYHGVTSNTHGGTTNFAGYVLYKD